MMDNSAKRRRRPGRFRRWVVRPAVWILVAAVVVFVGLVLYLGSPSFAERLRRTAEQRLAAALEREITVGDLALDLMPFTATLSEITIAGAAPGAEPSFTVERAVIEAGINALRGRTLDLRHVHLDRPRLRIAFDAEGRSDLPPLGGERAPAGAAPTAPFELRFGSIEVVDGELVIDENQLPLDFSARQLEAIFSGVDSGVELRGRAQSDDFGLRLPPGRSYGGALELHGRIRAHRFDLVRAEIVGPDLTARAAGFVRWHGDREVALDLEATGDLGVLGRLGYLDGQLSGPFNLEGELTRKPGILLVDAQVRSPRAVAFERVLTALETRVRADTNTLSVEIEQATHGGGSVRGAVALGLAAEPGRVDLDLLLEQVGLGRLLADLGVPIDRVGGGVSGVLNYQFASAAPEAGNGWADLVVADARVPVAGNVPLAGTIPLAIGRGVVRTAAARLAAPGFRLTARGAFDLATASGGYDFELEAERVAEVMRLVPGGDQQPPAAWRPTAGRGRAMGRLDLGPGGAAVRLDLDLVEAAAPGLVADRVTGVLAIDGGGVRELELEATRSAAALRVSTTVPFDAPPPTVEPIPFTLALDAIAWPLAESSVWLPFELPVDGPYTGSLELGTAPAPAAGTESEAVAGGLVGRFAGRVSPVARGGLAAQALAVEARFDPAAHTHERADLAIGEGAIAAAGTVSFEELALDLAFDSSPIDLSRARLTEALPPAVRRALAPVAGLSGRFGGRLAAPEIEARLVWVDPARTGADPGQTGAAGQAEIADPVGAPAPAGEVALELAWRDGRLTASGVVAGLATLAGGGELAPERIDLAFDLADGRLDRWVEALAPDSGLGGDFAGQLLVAGRWQPTPELATSLVLGRLVLRPPRPMADVPAPLLTNLEPVVVEVGGEGVRVRSLYLGDAAGASELFVGGRVAADGVLDLQLQTAVASDWLGLLVERFWPGARWSGGTFDAIATVEGDLQQPRINGVGEVRGARLVAGGLPTAVDDLTATVLFYRDQMVVDSASARFGGGRVRASGVVPLGGNGAAPAWRFQADGERLSYRSPDGWTARGDAAVVLAATAEGLQLTGGLILDQLVYVQDVKLGVEQLLRALFGAERLEVAPAEGWRAATQLNLRIEGEQALRLRNNLADLRGSADLVLRGTLARPVVFGQIEVEPGGRLEYSGADYEVERGLLSFANPYRIEPVIDLAARTELREYAITLNLAGTPERLALDFTSNPPLAELDVLALLTGASADPAAVRRAAAGAGSSGASVGAESFLYGQATSLLAQRFNRLFGLDKFRIDPLTGSTGDLSSARVVVGKQLSRDLLVTYSYDPSATDEQVLEIDWSVSRSLVLVLTQNGDGSYAVDARWERAF